MGSSILTTCSHWLSSDRPGPTAAELLGKAGRLARKAFFFILTYLLVFLDCLLRSSDAIPTMRPRLMADLHKYLCWLLGGQSY